MCLQPFVGETLSYTHRYSYAESFMSGIKRRELPDCGRQFHDISFGIPRLELSEFAQLKHWVKRKSFSFVYRHI